MNRTKWIQEPNLVLRCAAAGLSLAIILLVIFMVTRIHQVGFDNYVNFIQALDASLGSVVFIGAAIIFLVSWENRIKRQRALKAIHELVAEVPHMARKLDNIAEDVEQLKRDVQVFTASANFVSAAAFCSLLTLCSFPEKLNITDPAEITCPSTPGALPHNSRQ